ncbi:MAG: HEPN domain-containing protein [Candidatus Micrarchaeia archaeon]|jgi:HEPN domain-containing protein
MQEDVSLWLKQADEDFKTAELTFKSRRYYASAFLSQQAAEKALKAVYIRKFNDLAKVHDLVFLGRKVSLPEALVKDCIYLGRAYIESRYPGELKTPAEKFSSGDAERCLAIAEDVIKWVKTIL